MTWMLGKSRSIFFKETGESPRDSFWVSERERLREKGIDSVDLTSLCDWDPSSSDARSNCPALHETISELTSLVDDRWHARASNIYAGRTSANEDLAFAKHAQKGGVVAISSELSLSLIAYVNLWGRFLTLLDELAERSVVDWNVIEEEMRNDFGQLIASFQGKGLAALLGEWPLIFKSSSHQSAAAELVQSAERWIVAHELSHHILRDGTNRPDRLARETIEAGLQHAQVACEVAGMSAEKRREVEADLLAFELIAGEYAKDTNAVTVLQAYQGACMALVAVGHLTDGWVADSKESHPGVLVRLVILTKWTILRYERIVSEVLTQMPGELRLHRLAAAQVAFALWASGVVPNVVRLSMPVDWTESGMPATVANYLHLAVVLGDLSAQDAQKFLVEHDGS